MNVQKQMKPYLEHCEYRKELDEKTLKAYRIDLRQYFEFVQIDNPLKTDIEHYITNLHKNYKQKTVKRKIASVKAFYNYLEEEELIIDNPFRKIKLKFKEAVVLPRIILRSEIETLLNHMYCCKATAKEYNYILSIVSIAGVTSFVARNCRLYD